MALELTNENFEELALKAEKPVLIDFWAPWCGPCRMQAPALEEFATKRDDVVVAKINVDDAPALAQKYGVMSIPTILVLKDGVEVERSVGLSSVADLNNMVSGVIGSIQKQ